MPLHEVHTDRHVVIRRQRAHPHFVEEAVLAHPDQEDLHHAETSLVVHADRLQAEVALHQEDAVDVK